MNIFTSKCFNKFNEWDFKIDFSSIILYLNRAEQLRIVEEKFFILIIAFERLTALYAERIGLSDEHVPARHDFDPIKTEFYKLLETHKNAFGGNYEKARSILGNLNEMKRQSTTEKMYGVLDDLLIPVDDDMRELINVVRHKAVHRGDVGSGQEGVTSLYLLNELLREIMLRLIGYDGQRISRVLLEKNLY